MIKSRIVSGAIGLIAAASLSGCNGFFVPVTAITPGTSSGDYVYVANGSARTVSGYAITPSTGAVAAVANSPYSLAFSPTSLVVTPKNTFLYVGGLGALYVYTINTNGSLTVANGGAAVGSVLAQAMAVSPDGQWLFVLNSDAATLSEFQINTSTGALTLQTGAVFSVGGSSQAVAISPNAGYVVVAEGTGGDLVYSFNTTTGALGGSPQHLVPPNLTSDNALAIDANSAYLYIARSGSTGSGLAAYSIGNGGALTPVSGSPTASGTGPYSVALSSTGAYAYVGNRTDGTVSEYAVGAGGVLTTLSSSPFKAVGTLPIGMVADKSGKYIAVASNGGSPDLNLLAISSSSPGTLSSSTSTSTGTDPTNPAAIAATH